MKLSMLKSPVIKEFEFINPYTDEKTGIFITVNSVKSREGKEATHRMQIEIIEARLKEENFDKDNKLKQEIMKDITIRFMADLIVEWRGIEDEDGKKIKFTKEAAFTILKEYIELADAIYVFVNNAENFLKKESNAL